MPCGLTLLGVELNSDHVVAPNSATERDTVIGHCDRIVGLGRLKRKAVHEMLIEMLIVIVILGILATVVVMSVRGITDRGEDASCDADVRTLASAAEAYFAKHGGSSIPPDGADLDAFERTLANEGLLRETSNLYDLDADGAVLVNASSRCTTV